MSGWWLAASAAAPILLTSARPVRKSPVRNRALMRPRICRQSVRLASRTCVADNFSEGSVMLSAPSGVRGVALRQGSGGSGRKATHTTKIGQVAHWVRRPAQPCSRRSDAARDAHADVRLGRTSTMTKPRSCCAPRGSSPAVYCETASSWLGLDGLHVLEVVTTEEHLGSKWSPPSGPMGCPT